MNIRTYHLVTASHRHHARRARPLHGFTLIELLVVISIIALLIGILLPVLGTARSAARTVACLSNEKQWGLAVTIFAEENKGWFPLQDGAWSSPPTKTNPDIWYNALLEVVDQPPYHEVQSGVADLPADYIWYCPEAGPVDGGDIKNPFNYAVNKELTGGSPNKPPAPASGPPYQARFQDIEKAGLSQVVILGEPEVSVGVQSVVGMSNTPLVGSYNPTASPVDATEAESDAVMPSTAVGENASLGGGYRHPSKSVNYVFADGHAENRGLLESATNTNKPNLTTAEVVASGYPFGVWTNESGDMVWGSFYTDVNSPFN